MSLIQFIPFAMDIINKIFPSDSEEVAQKKVDLQLALLNAATAQDTAQNEVNKIEAASPDRFVSGWRPAIGWICAISLFYGFIVKDFIDYYLIMNGHPPLPLIDTGDLFALVTGMLGLGGLRSFEKMKGVSK